ncbi:MAG: transposase [Gammaproteobacteria bacterium]|nr:transposase [Gammaproteobacteria bacterium]
MNRLQAYKFRIEPNGEQCRAMRQFAGNARKVWNLALTQQKINYESGEKFVNSFGMNTWLQVWKKEYLFLSKSPYHTLQQVTKDLERAYKNFFEKRADYPVIKKKGKAIDSFRFPDSKQFIVDQVNHRIKLPKLGWIKYRNSREILGAPKNITLTQKLGHWYVSIQTERVVELQLHLSIKDVGIDVGIDVFAATSSGEIIAPINSFKSHQKRLAKYQRRMSHKTSFSSNWKKVKYKVQKIQMKIAYVRNDFLHNISTDISKNHAMIVVEDLKVGNMSKSATGTLAVPGEKVKQKKGLNRSILDQGWGEFRRHLEYKQAWSNGLFVTVNPRNTSRTCFCCGFVSAENRKTQARFECIECGYTANADVNAARNILAAGHAVLACGDPVQSGRSRKQEPTEVIMHVNA